jgi:hypothetical protein
MYRYRPLSIRQEGAVTGVYLEREEASERGGSPRAWPSIPRTARSRTRAADARSCP